MNDNTERESLRGSETPSAKLIFKWLGIVLGLSVVALILVGLALPRQWKVEVETTIEGEREQIHALVSDAERWHEWMFDPDEDEADMAVEASGAGVGATISWRGGGSTGEMTLVESDPATGVAWDGKIETDEINNHGTISYATLDDGRVRVTLVDEGTLPPIVGGYFVPIMNAGLGQHFEAALARLEHRVEAP